jgi:hypothetical protein
MELKLWEKEIPYQLEDVETPNLFRTFFLKTEKPFLGTPLRSNRQNATPTIHGAIRFKDYI